MDILKASALGILQGLTEFLPISSSGHLALLGHYLGYGEGTVMVIMMHAGTLLALIVYFRTDLFGLILSPFRKERRYSRLFWYLFIGSIPAGLVGGLLLPYIESLLDSMFIIGFCLICTGVILFLSGFAKGEKRGVGFRDAFLIGIAQAVALLPGISRSGITITTGVFLGLDRQGAANFSFLLAIPAILGAVVLQAVSGEGGVITPSLLIGAGASFVSSLLAIKFLLGMLRKRTLRPFSYYCFAIGILSILIGLQSGVQ
ncbi:undecaprenyl-diphosphate phosphatase [candidate division WOR-3 bacterium]|nr:undecaprenyl-diphosphate phosphatase [candidate division WOR-3 bacterium]